MSTALKSVNRKVTAQTDQATPDQVQNHAGGYVFQASDKSRLERFLILGTDGGTYYATEKKITNENVTFLTTLIHNDEDLVRNTLVDVSVNSRAYRNSPALFVLALLFVEGKHKAESQAAFLRVVRTSTHLFEVAQYIDNLGGWGRAKRTAVAKWYTTKNVDDLAYQLVKYRQREGWTHKDLLRLSHPDSLNPELANFALGKDQTGAAPNIIIGFNIMKDAATLKDVLATLENYPNLPWETIPTEFLKSPEVWKAIFYNKQLNGQALVRSITRLARIGAFDDMQFAADYAARLTEPEMIQRTKLHPINYLLAVTTHQNGQTDRNGYGVNKGWVESGVIVDALNDGFNLAFKAVEPAGKRTFIGVDCSGSMGSKAMNTELTSAQISAAMAMTIARTEPANIIMGFTSGDSWGHHTSGLTDLGISAKTSLTDAMHKVSLNNWGSTDCALPMIYAKEQGIEVDTFVVITDDETYAGNIHPFQALKEYRKHMGIDAKLAVLATDSNQFTIADPSDRNMLDFCGFDANVPKVLADFSAGRL